MGEDPESRLDPSRPREAGPSRARRVILLSTSLVLAVALGLWASRSGRPVSSPSATFSPSEMASPSPTPTNRTTSVGSRLQGVGPFAVFQTNNSASKFYAVDLGSPTYPKVTLGVPAGQTMFSVDQGQAWGDVAPIPIQTFDGEGTASTVTTEYWLMKRGVGFDDAPIAIERDVSRSLLAPDGSEIIGVSVVPDGTGRYAEIFIVPTDGSPPKKLARIASAGSSREDGVLSPLVWLPGGGWLAVPICGCGESGPRSWYAISPTGRISSAAWLGVPRDIVPGVSRSGRYVSMFDQPIRQCGPTEIDICAAGPSRLLLADTVEHRVRTLARYRNDLNDARLDGRSRTAISADGKLVATGISGSRAAEIFNARTGRSVALVSYRGYDLQPLALIDDTHLLLVGNERLLLGHVEAGRVHVTQVVRGPMMFAGWTR